MDLLLNPGAGVPLFLMTDEPFTFGMAKEFEVKTVTSRQVQKTVGSKDSTRMPLRELWVNVGDIKQAFINNNTVIYVLNDLFEKINNDSEGIYKLQLSSNDYSGKQTSIVDRNYLDKNSAGKKNRGLFEFKLNDFLRLFFNFF